MAEENKLPNDTFNVSIIETYERIVEIDADTHDEAIERAKQLHADKKIVLDENDYIGASFDYWDNEE